MAGQMSGRRELERRLRTLGDIDTILGVMKNLALMEAAKLSRILVAQRGLVTSLEETGSEFLRFHPRPRRPGVETKVLLLVGSQRGLCGDFNDLLLAALPTVDNNCPTSLKITVGDKLAGRLRADVHLDGPHAVEEIGQVIHAVMDVVGALLDRADGGGTLHLSALCHDPDSGVVAVRSLAPFVGRTESLEQTGSFQPHLNLAPAEFFAQLTEQHLLAAITEVFHRSLMAESRFRLNHIDGASRRMERRAAELKRKQSLVRQEEIIEEIEAILAGAGLDGIETAGVKPVYGTPDKPCKHR